MGIAGRFSEGDSQRGPPELGTARHMWMAPLALSPPLFGPDAALNWYLVGGADRWLLGLADQTKIAITFGLGEPEVGR
jgi:hypothetical protein